MDDEGNDGAFPVLGGESEVAAARAELAAFDCDHPEVRELLRRERAESTAAFARAG